MTHPDDTNPPNLQKPENRALITASLKLLALRDMSRIQFEKKLAAKEFSRDDIAAAVAWCEAEGWLNEARYAEMLARRLAHRYGASRIGQTLKQKGVDGEIVAETLAGIQDGEFNRARQVWSRKFADLPDSAEARAKQSRYLQSRGFSFVMIRRVLSGETIEAGSYADAQMGWMPG